MAAQNPMTRPNTSAPSARALPTPATPRRVRVAGALTIGAVLGLGLSVVAPTPAASAQIVRDSPEVLALKRQNVARMLVEVRDLELTETPLEDVIEFIANLTNADLEPLWIGNSGTGLDRSTPITVRQARGTALDLLEKVLAASDDQTGNSAGSTWQMTTYGSIEFGPRELLNRRQQLITYDINDLLFEVRDGENPPQFDLNTIFSQGGQGGGGGGQSPFQNQQQNRDAIDRDTIAQSLIDLLQALVQPEQWDVAGGSGGTIRRYENALLIRAADYIHRDINGYAWWPSAAQRRAVVEGERRVTLTGDGLDLQKLREARPAAAIPATAPSAPSARPARSVGPWR